MLFLRVFSNWCLNNELIFLTLKRLTFVLNHSTKQLFIMNSSEMLFVVWDLKRLWMKWMRRKRLESDWMDERDREAKAGDCQLYWGWPYVYLTFLKGTSVDERKNENILDRVRLVVS